MRTTVTLAEDVAAAVERVRRERSVGVSEAVNELVREGLISDRHDEPFVQKTYPMGLKADVTNVERALEELEGPSAPCAQLAASLSSTA